MGKKQVLGITRSIDIVSGKIQKKFGWGSTPHIMPKSFTRKRQKRRQVLPYNIE